LEKSFWISKNFEWPKTAFSAKWITTTKKAFLLRFAKGMPFLLFLPLAFAEIADNLRSKFSACFTAVKSFWGAGGFFQKAPANHSF
jgi:hypothetical protein